MTHRVLNVGGGHKSIPLPSHYAGWEHLLLDIDPKSEADVICDARQMDVLMQAGRYDAIFCSHNLEHFHRHDIPKVLAGMRHVLREDGFAEIRVPDILALIQRLAARGEDLDSVMYVSPAGPIKALDMLYGLGSYIEASGTDFMCHKTGFILRTLGNTLAANGFPHVFLSQSGPAMELRAYAFKNKPSEDHMRFLKLSYAGSGGPVDNAGSGLLTAQPEAAPAGHPGVLAKRFLETV